MAPTTVDGLDIDDATIDGTEVSEITVDGNVVFKAEPDIPDSELLYARYDASELDGFSEGDSVGEVPDKTGNGFDVTGTGTYRENAVNGLDAIELDGVDDDFEASNPSNWTFLNDGSDYTIAAAMVKNNLSDRAWVVTTSDSATSNSVHILFGQDDGDTAYWKANGSDWILFEFGASPPVGEGFIQVGDMTDSVAELRLDGSTQVTTSVSGFSTSDPVEPLTIGSETTANFFDGYLCEILIYEGNPDVGNVESYLSDKWGS